MKIDKLPKKDNKGDRANLGVINRCPELMRRYKNNRMRKARVGDDCLSCKFCLELEHEPPDLLDVRYVYCIGHIPDALDGYKLDPFQANTSVSSILL